jgi:molybdopterin molybdotransferase
MAQLSDDCFAFGGEMLSVEAAQALIAERVEHLGGEEAIPLAAAIGRVLARDLHASLPLPPFRNAAVDGYAFRHADLAADTATTALALRGRVVAGDALSAHAPLLAGHAVRAFTGAPLPDGADTVLMQEDARFDAAGALLTPRRLAPGSNVREVGEDLALGALALPAGRRLRPPGIGLAAALGKASLPVRPLLRVGVFSTGDELRTPGSALGPAQTFDSNRATLLALLHGLPVQAADLGILPDDPVATAAALGEAAGRHDLLLTSGGVSAGDEDHVRAAIQQGGHLVFWRLAVKPGRPAALGVLRAGGRPGRGTPVVGLPGNPVAAIVIFLHLARPLILRLAGAAEEPLPRFPASAAFHHRKKAGRREYARVTLGSGDPLPTAHLFPRDGAGLLTSLTGSDAFAELAEEATEVVPGDVVRVLPFACIF